MLQQSFNVYSKELHAATMQEEISSPSHSDGVINEIFSPLHSDLQIVSLIKQQFKIH